MQTAANFYTHRNAEIIRVWKSLRTNGQGAREALKTVAEAHSFSEGLVKGVIYGRGIYPYAEEAWQIIDNEEKEAKAKESVDLPKS